MNETASPRLDDRCILVVEDEFMIFMAIRKTLQDAGAEVVECARSLSDAFAHLQDNQFDAAILDIRLPDGRPDALARQLQASGIAFIFHSGHVEPDLLRDFPKVPFCSKPSAAETLLSALNDALNP